MWKNPLKMPSNIKKEINESLQELCTGKYYDQIPLDKIFEILENNNAVALQEDGALWEGILCGNEARVSIELGAIWNESENEGVYVPCDNVMLVMSWYRMGSGRYEINTYVS